MSSVFRLLVRVSVVWCGVGVWCVVRVLRCLCILSLLCVSVLCVESVACVCVCYPRSRPLQSATSLFNLTGSTALHAILRQGPPTPLLCALRQRVGREGGRTREREREREKEKERSISSEDARGSGREGGEGDGGRCLGGGAPNSDASATRSYAVVTASDRCLRTSSGGMMSGRRLAVIMIVMSGADCARSLDLC